MRFIRKNCLNNLEILVATESGFSFPGHYHDTVCLTLILEGVEHSGFNLKNYHVMAGEITVLAPHIVHSNIYSKSDTISFATFYVDYDLFRYFNRGNHVRFDFVSIKDDYLFNVLKNCIQLSVGNEPKFEYTFCMAVNYLVNKHLVKQPLVLEKSNGVFKTLIEEIDGRDFLLVSTARKMGIDQYKLIRIFKDETGMTPKQFFNYQKIVKSKTMITSGMPISEILTELDFYDYSHFNRQFKRFTGITPQQYQGVV